MKITEYMGFELIEKISNKEITIQEVIQQSFDRIEETDSIIHSFVHLSKEKALKKSTQIIKFT